MTLLCFHLWDGNSRNIWKLFSFFLLKLVTLSIIIFTQNSIKLNERLRKFNKKNLLNTISKIVWFMLFTVLDVAHYWRSLSSVLQYPAPMILLLWNLYCYPLKMITSFWIPLTLYSLLMPSFYNMYLCVHLFLPLLASRHFVDWLIFCTKCFVHNRDPRQYLWDSDRIIFKTYLFICSFSISVAPNLLHLLSKLPEVSRSPFLM